MGFAFAEVALKLARFATDAAWHPDAGQKVAPVIKRKVDAACAQPVVGQAVVGQVAVGQAPVGHEVAGQAAVAPLVGQLPVLASVPVIVQEPVAGQAPVAQTLAGQGPPTEQIPTGQGEEGCAEVAGIVAAKICEAGLKGAARPAWFGQG